VSKPPRIQRKRVKGWKLPEGAVCVTLPGTFGNPFLYDDDQSNGYSDGATFAKYAFRVWMGLEHGHASFRDAYPERKADLLRRLSELRGKPLACYCKPGAPCHADDLIVLANR
jgi:hypothetical protein